MTDWVHRRAEEEFENEKSSKVRGSKADNILLDGVGRGPKATSAYDGEDIRWLYPITEILPGQKVRLRVINGAAGTSFIFSVDGHKIEVIANDLVPVKPTAVDSLLVAIGLLPLFSFSLTKANNHRSTVRCHHPWPSEPFPSRQLLDSHYASRRLQYVPQRSLQQHQQHE